MINGVKARIETVAALKSVELGHELPAAAIENMNTDSTITPSVLLYYGNYEYAEPESKMRTRQMSEKRIVALLFCRVSEFDALHDAVVRAVLGFHHTPKHQGMTVLSSATARILGPLMARRIEFGTETLISQL